MLGIALATLALASPAPSCSVLPVGSIGIGPYPAVGGTPVTICVNPVPGPAGRSFEWDIGDDGSVDAITSEPQFEVASPSPPELLLGLRYQTDSGPRASHLTIPVQEPPPPPTSSPIQPSSPPNTTPSEPATIRVENDTLIYQGTAGGRDELAFSVDKPREWVARGSVEPGPGCARKTKPTVYVSCPPTHNAQVKLGDHGKNLFGIEFVTGWKFKSVTVTGGAGTDNIRALAPGATVTVDGGPGNDTVESSGAAFGGPGDDRVTGSKRAVGGDGDDRVVGFTGLVDGGAGNDSVRVRGRNVKVLLGPGNDTFIGYGLNVRVYGGNGNDLFRVPLMCICGLFGGAGNDTFHTVTSLVGGPGPERSQFMLGGSGRDTGLLDGSDCARGVEQVMRTKLTGSDNRYRCKPPSVNLRP
jgi:hypothetical protein